MINRNEEKINWLLYMVIFTIPVAGLLFALYQSVFGTREKMKWGKASFVISLIIHLIIIIFIIRFIKMPYEDLYNLLNKIK